MDVGGSFLDFACIRIAVVPAGSISDARFAELAALVDIVNELPTNALPKPQSSPRRSFLTGPAASGAATYSHAPLEIRAAHHPQQSRGSVERSRSIDRDRPEPRRTHSLSPVRSIPTSNPVVSKPEESQTPVASTGQKSAVDGTSSTAASAGGTATIDSNPPPSGVSGVSYGSAVGSEASPSSSAMSPTAELDGHGGTASNKEPVSTVSHKTLIRSSSAAVSSPSLVSTLKSTAAVHGANRFPRGSPSHLRNWPQLVSSDRDSAMVRLRYDIIPRDSSGNLVMRPPSDWDSFHSRRVWGVVGIVDCTDPQSSHSAEWRDRAIAQARAEFFAALGHFRNVPVSRLIVFTTSAAVREGGTFVTEVDTVTMSLPTPSKGLPGASPKSTVAGVFSGTGSFLAGSSNASALAATLPPPNSAAAATGLASPMAGDAVVKPISIGYVPMASPAELRLEIRAQIVHFAGLVMAALEEWMKHESIATDVFISPLDAHNAADKKSKLDKRRQGRLDKLQGDYCLLTGSAAQALGKFNSAIERAKANSDSLWLAGAMEGAAAAQVYTHVAEGHKADDPVLVDRVIEQYHEIYKLYHKKRVAELEATAALRLAEYLGRWTDRRKDAMDAADHASSLGEGLRNAKRQALWEALARFFESMGCRRKAAIFMYRLGQLDASEDVWTKAMTLMTAAGQQFHGRHGGSWPGLHRRVLLEAASAGRKAGDYDEAACLAVEALALSPEVYSDQGQSDAEIVQTLLHAPIPPLVPFADRLLTLKHLSAVRLYSLSVQEYKAENSPSRSSSSVDMSRNDPYLIFNPFEARRTAARKAEAGRVVTWVCGETAHLAMELQNELLAPLGVEVVAVDLVASGNEREIWPAVMLRSGEVSGWTTSKNTATVVRQMQSALRTLGQTATTVSQTFTLPPRATRLKRKSKNALINISVVPRIPGNMRLSGIVLRLLSGCVVRLGVPEPKKEADRPPPIDVKPPLPKLEVLIQANPCDAIPAVGNSSVVSLFEGECRVLRVWIRNVGYDNIGQADIMVRSTDSTRLRINSVGSGHKGVQEKVANLKRGSAEHFDIRVYALQQFSSALKPDVGTEASGDSAAVSVLVEYVGEMKKSHVRTSSATMKVAVAPAVSLKEYDIVRIEALAACPRRATSGAMPDIQSSPVHEEQATAERLCLVAELGNCTSLPIHLTMVAVKRPSGSESLQRTDDTSSSRNDGFMDDYQECTVESGSSVRLMSSLLVGMDMDSDNLTVEESWSEDGGMKLVSTPSDYAGTWSLPSLGRHGAIRIPLAEVMGRLTALVMRVSESVDSTVASAGVLPALKSESTIGPVCAVPLFGSAFADIHVSVDEVGVAGNQFRSTNGGDSRIDLPAADDSFIRRSSMSCEKFGAGVVSRRYYSVHIVVRNDSGRALSSACTLDVRVCQRDGRGHLMNAQEGCLVGLHEGVPCGGLPPGKSFAHSLLLRFGSTGLYDIIANLYDYEPLGVSSDCRQESMTIGENPSAAATATTLPGSTISANEEYPDLAAAKRLDTASEPRGGEVPVERTSSLSQNMTPLRRVGLARGKRAEDARGPHAVRYAGDSGLLPGSPSGIQPLPLDRAGDGMRSIRRTPPLSVGLLTVQAVSDTRWSAGLLRPFSNSQSLEDKGTPGSRANEPLPETHHSPDTMIH